MYGDRNTWRTFSFASITTYRVSQYILFDTCRLPEYEIVTHHLCTYTVCVKERTIQLIFVDVLFTDFDK